MEIWKNGEYKELKSTGQRDPPSRFATRPIWTSVPLHDIITSQIRRLLKCDMEIPDQAIGRFGNGVKLKRKTGAAFT